VLARVPTLCKSNVHLPRYSDRNVSISYRHEKSSSLPPWPCSLSIMSTFVTRSFVSCAIWNAIGGRDDVHVLQALSPSSSSRPSFAMARPVSPDSIKRCLMLASLRTTGSPCVLSAPFPVEAIAFSVAVTTVPTTSETAATSFRMAVIPASERMEETRDCMFWTNRAV